jgi:hypothetical protein
MCSVVLQNRIRTLGACCICTVMHCHFSAQSIPICSSSVYNSRYTKAAPTGNSAPPAPKYLLNPTCPLCSIMRGAWQLQPTWLMRCCGLLSCNIHECRLVLAQVIYRNSVVGPKIQVPSQSVLGMLAIPCGGKESTVACGVQCNHANARRHARRHAHVCGSLIPTHNWRLTCLRMPADDAQTV